MTIRFLKTATLLACALCSTIVLADPPALVGRVSLVQGQVGISGDVGDAAGAAQLNWPVTSHNQISTGRGARTEIRIGSSSVRLDAQSSMEVSELDDDRVQLRLNYGSASVRIVNPEVAPGFALSTPNGVVRLQGPGRVRVDAGRDGTAVSVFDGVALAEDRGSQLIVRAGKRADIRDDDVRTGPAVRDGFDDWAQQRDQADDRSTSARYVGREMTGYEDLDRNGAWRDDAEYGPLWLPSMVAPGWAPYRDGSWTWIAPWGWTWVDNAPWGYAPFHYGRWVQLDQRWAWAPGRQAGSAVWSPALVGWVGGNGWNASFGGNGGARPLPAQGWYPLAPRDAFVPGYRLSPEHLQRINRDAWPDGRGDAGRRDGRGGPPHDGLTVVPQAQFGQRGTIAVRNAPQAVVPPQALRNAPATAPGAPQGAGRDGRLDRFDGDAMQRNRQPRPELSAVPAPRQSFSNPAIPPGQPPVQAPSPSPSPSPFSRRDGRPGFDDGARRQQPAPTQAPLMLTAPTVAPTPTPAPSPGPFGVRDVRPAIQRQPPAPVVLTAPPVAPTPAPAPSPGPFGVRDVRPDIQHQPTAPPAAAPMPAPPAAMQPQRERGFRNDGERRMRDADPGAAMPAQQPRQPPPAAAKPAAPSEHNEHKNKPGEGKRPGEAER